ncbi:hypothetical protein D3C73_904940 [compost metagenome]
MTDSAVLPLGQSFPAQIVRLIDRFVAQEYLLHFVVVHSSIQFAGPKYALTKSCLLLELLYPPALRLRLPPLVIADHPSPDRPTALDFPYHAT